MSIAPDVVQEIPDVPTVVEGFGDDPLGRVQGLLFGEHAQRTNERLELIEQTLFDMVAELRASVEVQLGQLAQQLESEVQTRADEISALDGRIGREVKALTKVDNAFGRKLEKTSTDLRGRISDTAATAATALESARLELTTEVDGLQNRSVERAGLALLLRSVANDLDS